VVVALFGVYEVEDRPVSIKQHFHIFELYELYFISVKVK